jgi:hypothetical protein
VSSPPRAAPDLASHILAIPAASPRSPLLAALNAASTVWVDDSQHKFISSTDSYPLTTATRLVGLGLCPSKLSQQLSLLRRLRLITIRIHPRMGLSNKSKRPVHCETRHLSNRPSASTPTAAPRSLQNSVSLGVLKSILIFSGLCTFRLPNYIAPRLSPRHQSIPF